jgi:hypothetical protein
MPARRIRHPPKISRKHSFGQSAAHGRDGRMGSLRACTTRASRGPIGAGWPAHTDACAPSWPCAPPCPGRFKVSESRMSSLATKRLGHRHWRANISIHAIPQYISILAMPAGVACRAAATPRATQAWARVVARRGVGMGQQAMTDRAPGRWGRRKAAAERRRMWSGPALLHSGRPTVAHWNSSVGADSGKGRMRWGGMKTPSHPLQAWRFYGGMRSNSLISVINGDGGGNRALFNLVIEVVVTLSRPSCAIMKILAVSEI